MNIEIKFILKVIRNALILSGLYFTSVWASGSLNWIVLKPIIIFILSYLFIELAKRYGLDYSKIKTNINTIIF